MRLGFVVSAFAAVLVVGGALSAAGCGGSAVPVGGAGGAVSSNGSGPGSGGAGPASGGSASSGGAGAGGAQGGAVGTGGLSSVGGAGGGAGGGVSATGGQGGSASGGAPAGGGSGTGGGTNPGSGLGTGMQEGQGSSSMQYATAMISRDQVPYILITNGWGPGFESHTISWLGTSFTVDAMKGTAGSGGQPASYPSVFCGKYSVKEVPACGLPAQISSLKSLKTGWRWSSNGNDDGEYNAAYDIWVGNGTQLQGYLMVWLRDPKSYQPAGMKTTHLGVTVEGLPGKWDIWSGTVNGLPITNWVKAEGDQIPEIEFDVLDVLKDAQMRNITYPGTHINAVAVGFEIWEGPIAGLKSDDFYVTVEQ